MLSVTQGKSNRLEHLHPYVYSEKREKREASKDSGQSLFGCSTSLET